MTLLTVTSLQAVKKTFYFMLAIAVFSIVLPSYGYAQTCTRYEDVDGDGFSNGTTNASTDCAVDPGATWYTADQLVDSAHAVSTLDDDLELYWNLDNGSANDSSGNSRTGTIVGASESAGQIEEGLSFDGSNDSIYVDGMPTMTDFTVSFWVKNDGGDSGYDRLFSSTSNRFEISRNNAGTLRMYGAGIGFSAWRTSGYSLSSGQWVHLTAVRANNRVTLYADGKVIYVSNSNGNAVDMDRMRFGCTAAGSECSNTVMDDIRVYSRALSLSEIQQLVALGDRITDGDSAANNCSDADSSVTPLTVEVCDGIDNDCDGTIDEDLHIADWYSDIDGDGIGGAESLNQCNPGVDRFANYSTYQGIDMGVSETNIDIITNQWNGSANQGEHDFSCPGGDANCYFIADGVTYNSLDISRGVASDDNYLGDSFIMYSATNAVTRFNANANNSESFINVRYNGGWEYNRNQNGTWVDFTPVATDRLFAKLLDGGTSYEILVTEISAIGDNCPDVSNPDQADTYKDVDGDGFSDGTTASSCIADYYTASQLVETATSNAGLYSGLVAHYTFDNNDATDSIGDNDGVVQGGVGFTSSKISLGLDLDGIDDSVSVNNDATLNLNELTVSSWIYVDSSVTPETYGVIVDKPHTSHVDPYYSYHLRLNSVSSANPTLTAIIVAGGAYSADDQITISGEITKDTWHHVSMTYDGTDINVYVDGNNVGGKNNPGTLSYSVDEMYIGAFKNLTSGNFPGKIDDVRIYNRALSSIEMENLHTATNTYADGDSVANNCTDVDGSAYPIASELCDGVDNNCDGATDEGMTGTYYLDADGDGFSDGTTASYCAEDSLTQGLLAQYTYDDGDVTDSSSAGNNGTESGTLLYDDGKNGGGVNLDDAQDSVDTTISIASDEDFTFSSWVYIDNLSVFWKGLMGEGSTNRYSLYAEHGARPLFYHYDDINSSNILLYGSNWTTTGWKLVTLTRSGNTYTMYQDGVQTGTTTRVSNIDLTSLQVGGFAPSHPASGKVDDSRVYDRALSALEVNALYNTTNTYRSADALKVTAQSTSVQDGLIARYSFDNGDATDSSGNGNTGTEVGGVAYEPGLMGQAARFDGIDDWIELGNRTMGEQESVSLWFNTTSTDGSDFAYAGYSCGGGQCDGGLALAFLNSTGRIYGTAGGATLAGPVSNDGNWHHAVHTYNIEGDVVLYIDGVEVSRGTADTDILHVGNNQYIGTLLGNATYAFDGLIDEVRIYDRELSSVEIADLYAATNTVYPTETTVCDATALTHPGVLELCDGVDNNCDGTVDNDSSFFTTFYLDVDADGYSEGTTEQACFASTNYQSIPDLIDTSTSEVQLDEQLIAHYQFDNNTNDVIYSNNGDEATTEYVDGQVVEGLSFNNNNADSVSVATADELKLVGQDATFSTWIKKTSNAGYDGIIGNNFNNGRWFLGSADKIGLFVGGTAPADVAESSGTIPLDTWTHITAVWTHTTKTVDFYINGVFDSSETVIDDITDGGDTFYIGNDGRDGVGYPLDGDIDELRIYSRALTALDIENLYRATTLYATGDNSANNNCSDSDATLSPSAIESCDNIDNDCDGEIDEGAGYFETYYQDLDGDGFSDGTELTACGPLANFATASDLIDTATSSVGLDNGLVVHYEFDDETADDALGVQDGAENGDTSYNPSEIGKAATFDGTADYIDINGGVISGQEYTASAWFKVDGNAGQRRFILESSGSFEISLEVMEDNTLRAFAQKTSGWSSYDSSFTVTPGTRYHVVSTYNNGELSLYANGTKLGSSGSGGTLAGSENGLHIGSYRNGDGRWFNGDIDEVRIYNRSLTDNEVAQLYTITNTFADGDSAANNCNDNDAFRNPIALEVCDNIDNDCDGVADDADPDTQGKTWFFTDTDGDGYGTGSVTHNGFDFVEELGTGGDTWNIAVGDVDGDGDLDMHEVKFNQQGILWINNGAGGFTASEITGDLGAGEYNAFLDVENDGDLDLYVGNFGTQNKLWINNGTGGFTASDITGDLGNTSGLTTGDFNGDGFKDIYVANFGQNKLWINDQDGTFTAQDITGDAGSSIRATAGDIDSDGDIDIYVSNYSNQQNKLWINDGTGSFTANDITGDLGNTRDGIMGDLDGDGDVDIYTVTWAAQNIVWINDGSENFTAQNIIGDTGNGRGVALEDVDMDGDLDIYVANSGQANQLRINNGSASFTDGSATVADSDSAVATQSVTFGDFDKDGDRDYVLGLYGPTIELWINDTIFTNAVEACSAPANTAATFGDCDEANGDINPGATELCDGIDNDCDLVIDNGITLENLYLDADGDGYSDGTTAASVCGDLSYGQLAYYTFDDGTAEDQSGNGNDGSFAGNATVGNSSSGKNAQGLLLDGDDDYLDTPITDITVSSESFTFATRVNLNTNAGANLMSKCSFTDSCGENGDIGLNLFNGTLRFGNTFDAFGNWIFDPSTPTHIATNTWTHVVATYNASTNYAIVYVDGSEAISGTVGINSVNTQAFKVGGYGNVDGTIDEVRFYDRVLTVNEIDAIYKTSNGYHKEETLRINAMNNTLQDDLAVRWSFDNDTATDVTGNGNDGTLGGAVTFFDGYVGNAGNFDGNADQVTMTYGDFNTNETYSVWFNTANIGQDSFIFGRDNPNANRSQSVCGGMFLLGGQLRSSLITNTQVYRQAASVDAFSANTWNHAVMTKDVENGELSLYLNGELQQTISFDSTGYGTFSNIDRCTANLVSLGKYNSTGGGWNGSTHFTGQLDEARIYTHVLESSEVKELYDAGQTLYNTVECNDNDASIHPGVQDLCGDNVDNNCDGDVDYKAGSPSTEVCEFCDHYQLTTSYEECKALEAFYTSTNGGSWADSTGWLSSPDISTWYGVTTDGTSPTESVIELDLTNNNVTGTLPSTFADLTALTRLSLFDNVAEANNNEVGGELPASFFTLPNLTYVDFDNNAFTGSISGLSDITTLTYFGARTNNFTGLLPDFTSLSGLTVFSVTDNNLTGTIPVSVGSLTSATTLWLGGNNLTGSIPEEIGDMTALVDLRLSDNNLTGSIPEEITGASNLQILALRDNSFSGIISDISALSNVSLLLLHNNSFDRDNEHNALIPPYLTTWYNGITTKNISGQSDLTTPVITTTDKIPPVISSPISYDITVDEGSYVVAGTLSEAGVGSGSGLLVEFSGTSAGGLACSNLSADPITDITGTVTLTISASTPGVYEGCTLQVRDHGNNLSNEITLSTVCSDPALTIPQNECIALVDFYVSTDGFNWTNDTNWLIDPDVDTRHGLNADSSVRWIALGNNNLTGTIPASIAQLQNLEILNASQNNLSGTLPAELWTATIRQVSLGSNAITGFTSDITNAVSLDSLYLSDNQLTGAFPASLLSTNLEQLSLSENNLSGVLPDLSDLGDTMLEMELSGNNFTGEFPDTWSTFNVIESLQFNDNTFIGSFPESITQIANPGDLSLNFEGNNFDRDNTHSVVLTTTQQVWTDSLDEYIGSSQGDNTFPIVTNIDADVFTITGQLDVTFDIDENSYAIAGNLAADAAAGEGMPITITGPTVCNDLSATSVTTNSGSTSTTITSSSTGLFDSCVFEIKDHNDNETVISIPPLVFGSQLSDICTHPDISVPVLECQALVALYEDTGGNGWANSAGWFDSVDVNTWYGITVADVAGTDHVTSVSLPRNNLKFILPAQLGDLDFATEMNFEGYGNQTQGITNIAESFSKNNGLRTLILDGNQLLTLPTDIGYLTNLRDLSVSNNLITSLPSGIKDLDTLDILSVDGNQLTSLPTDINSLPELDLLDISSNDITELPSLVGTDLKILDASGNKLSSLPADFDKLGKLQDVNLSSNNLTSIGASFKGLDSITTLVASNNQLTNVEIDLYTLTSLITLDLSSNLIDRFGEGIDKLGSLENLNLDNNLLTSIPTEIGKLPSIKELKLSNNQIGELPLDIEQATTLEKLFLSNNELRGLPRFIGNLINLKQFWINDNDLHGGIPDEYSNLTNLNRFIIYNNFLDRVLGNTAYLQPGIDTWAGGQLGFDLGPQDDDTKPVLSGTGTVPPLAPSFAYEITVTENSYAIDQNGDGLEIVFAGGANCSELTAIVDATGRITVDEKTGTHNITVSSILDANFENCTLQVEDHAGNISDPVVLGSFQLSNTIETFCSHPTLSITESECNALYVLYTETDGDEDGWTNDANWFVSLDVETWFGVETTSFSGDLKEHVTGLYLHKSSGSDEFGPTSGRIGNDIDGPLPGNLGNLTYLENINLSGNEGVTGTLPGSIATLTALEQLWMRDTSLSGVIPSQIGTMDAMIAFMVEGNDFTSLPTEFFDLASLKSVDLSDNQFAGVLEDSWDSFTDMVFVDLSNNSFADEIPGTLGYISGSDGNPDTLKTLYLHGNEFTGTIPQSFNQLIDNSILENFRVNNNNLDRTNLLDAVLQVGQPGWYGGIGGSTSIANQGDITQPVLTGTGSIPFSVTTTATYDLTVTENSFAVTTDGEGMTVSAQGTALCNSLTVDALTTNNGTQTVTITPDTPGLYDQCELIVTDHGGNVSNTITIPTFGFNLGDAQVCFDQNLTIPTSECLALLIFYQSTGGEDGLWTNDNNWFDEAITDVDQWFGIETAAVGTDGKDHVTKILMHTNTATTDARNILDGNGLTGEMPDIYGSFPFLETLYLDGNVLTGLIPSTIGTLSSIKNIGLSNNQLIGEIPSAFDTLTTVELFDISDNQIADTYPTMFDNSLGLVTVDISNNAFSGGLLIADNTLTQVTSLNIANNGFDALLPSSIAGITGLVELNASNNQFVGALPNLGGLAQLQTLHLENNQFTNEIPALWNGLDDLRTFTIQNNLLEGNPIALLGGLDALETLNIANNLFEGRLGGQFSSSPLTSLDISGNNLDRSPDHKALIVDGFIDRYAPPQMLFIDTSNQGDVTAPDLTSEQPIYSPVAGSIEYAFTIDENSYAVDNVGVGMAFDIVGPGCSGLFKDISEITQQTGTINVSIFATNNQVYNCELQVTDHAGNTGTFMLPTFWFNSLCGNGVTDAGEVCDEGSFCDDGTNCTNNAGICPSECRPRLTDNCNPSCQASRCGDRYVDPDGIDNISGNFDDETCDEGSFCNNGTDCTNDPTVCANGAFECNPRVLNGCSARCTAGTCGDGSYDPDGADNIEGTDDDEECDDGNLNGGDGCSASCTVEFCGDGFVDSNGPNNDGVGAEQCDQGPNNGLVGGVCSSTCTLPNDECVFCYETCDGGAGQHEIFLMMDSSGSMGTNNRMQNAINGALNFVDLVETAQEGNPNFTTKIGVIDFDSDASILVNPENLGTTEPYANVKNAINNNLVVGGGTNFGDPIQAALNYFNGGLSDPNFTYHIILLSDGEPTTGGPAPYQDPGEWALVQANLAKNANVNLYTIAVDQSDEGIEYMSYLSSSTRLNQAWRGPKNGTLFNKPVAQSSTYSNNVASLANNATKSGTQYSLTNATYQSRWEINLNNTIEVETVNVRNRTTNVTETSDFYVHLSSNPFGSQTLDQILADPNVTSIYTAGNAGRPSEIDFGGQQGQYVRVQKAEADPNAGATPSGETFSFVDTGGTGGNYSNYEDYVTTFCPSNSTERLTIRFSSFNLENRYDYMYFYNGDSTNDTYLGRATGSSIPNDITSTSSDGCLTMRFISDFSITRSGWEATLTADTLGAASSYDENLGLSEVEIIGCDATTGDCTDIYHYQDFGGVALDTLYGHVFGNIHCDCPPERVCGVCGDGAQEPTVGEECDTGSYCDDWNGTTGTACVLNAGGTTECDADPALGECRPRLKDGCTDQCKLFYCGDGITQYLDEAYVITNSITGDACFTTNDCGFTEYCAGVYDGSGVTERICVSQAVLEAGATGAEECDDGGTASGDGCGPTCQFEGCGDGFYDFDGPDDIFGNADDEGCDDGNTIDEDGCSSLCVEENDCGDGVLDLDGADDIFGTADDETCDEGSFCDDLATVPCVSDAYCSSIGFSENSCRPRFINECTPSCDYGICGDNIVDVNGADNTFGDPNPSDDEQCDGGRYCSEGSITTVTGEPLDVSGSNCTQDPTICGTGTCETTNLDYCSQYCLLPFCGDNFVTDNEITISYYECIAGANECGDGLVDPDGQDNEVGTPDDEQCDDGNTDGGDGCSATCKFEENAGNGGVNYCINGVQDSAQGETGIDCGGDCQVCPTCNDYIQNGDETGIDCGGSCTPC